MEIKWKVLHLAELWEDKGEFSERGDPKLNKQGKRISDRGCRGSKSQYGAHEELRNLLCNKKSNCTLGTETEEVSKIIEGLYMSH